MKISPKTPALLFSGGILLCLLQIWLPGYYLTADGPSHVYNAQILHDLWSNKNVAFYDRFYNQVAQPNPNWTAHILLTAFMYVVDGFVAEKLLLSLYMILFCGGFYLLLKKISGRRAPGGLWLSRYLFLPMP